MPHHPLSGSFVDDPSCREIYADSFEIRVDSSGVVRIDLCAQRWNPDDQNDQIGKRMLVARVAMSLPLAGVLTDALRREVLGNVDTEKYPNRGGG
jgi:hypothetical protein